MTATIRVPAGAPEHANPLDAANPEANQWVSVGPAVTVRGQQTGLPRLAGRITAIAVSADGQRVYAGAARGGVWYSGDGGAHWTALDFYSSAQDAAGARQHADAFTVGAIGVIWGTVATDVVFVGAGEHPTGGLETPSASIQAVGIRVATGPFEAVSPAAGAFVGAAAADPWRVEATELAGVAVNRFAFDLVSNGVVWAATSSGLLKRTPGAPAQWDDVNAGLGDAEFTDVVIVPGIAANGEQQRIYAVAAGGALARSTDGAHWQTIALPVFPEAEAPAATAIARVQLAAGNVPNHAVVYAIADGPRLWRIDGDAAEIVSGVPRAVTDADPETPKPFKLAVAVHPATDAAHQDVIVVGGQTLTFPGTRRQAALFMGQVSRVGATLTFPKAAAVGGAPAEWIGSGVSSGVQALTWLAPAAAPATHLWAGTDGGVFRSDADGASGTFKERNTGLGVVEATTFAQSSDTETVMIVGTRGDGLLARRGNETWEVVAHDRTAGVAIDPGNARNMYVQWTRSAWKFTEDGAATPFTNLEYQSKTPLGLAPAAQKAWDDARKAEQDGSAWSSRMGMLAVPDSSLGTLRALGTNRVWYTDAERHHVATLAARDGSLLSGWVTLPSLSDPYDSTRPGAPFGAQDQLAGAVLAVVWGTKQRLYALTEERIYFFEQNADGTWKAAVTLYDRVKVQQEQKRKTPPGQIPYELSRISLAVHDADNGQGTLYCGTSGPADKQHLWWYDGAATWKETGFAIDTAIYTIVVDPQQPEIVYLGTDRGVYKGTGNFPDGAAPNWAWELFSNGLPGAPCVDLSIFSPAGSARRLLRAALDGRGVWEVLLDGVAQGPEVYLRAHDFDAGRRGVPGGGPRNPFSEPGAQVPLDASPDVRVRRRPVAAAEIPRPLAMQPLATAGYDRYTIGVTSDSYDIWLMHAALRARGEDIDPRAAWDPVVSAAARTHQQGVLVPPPATSRALWEQLLSANPLPLERDGDHADLVAHVRDEPDRWPKDARSSCSAGDLVRVSVTVHSRHWAPVATGTVSVALIKTRYGRHHSVAGTAALPAAWGTALRQDLAGPLVAGRLGADWSYADAAAPFRAVAAPLDPLNPQVVSFDVSLAGGSWNTPGWLLLAVVLRTGDAVPMIETDVETLVRTDGRVAARSVRKAFRLQQPLTVYAAMDKSQYPTQATMEQAWRQSNLFATGLYLDSPAPAAGEVVVPPQPQGGTGVVATNTSGHNRNGTNPAPGAVTAWMRARREIWPAWGLLPLYWAQQDPRNGWQNAAGDWVAQGPFDQRDVMGFANGRDAAAKARQAGFPTGAVIYLDYETDFVPYPAGLQYLRAFFHMLADAGYRPGVYCRPVLSAMFRTEVAGLFVWSVRNLNPVGPVADMSPAPEAQIVFRTPELTAGAGADPTGISRQWRLDAAGPAGNPVPGIFGIDGDVTLLADPSFPERRYLSTRAGGLIRIAGGRATAAPIAAAGSCAVYAVRRCRPARASGLIAALAVDAASDLVKDTVKYLWNPYSTHAALSVPGPVAAPDPTDIFLAIGFAESEGEEVQRLQMLRRPPGREWQHATIPDSGFAIDPLSGVCAVTRGDQSIDAFVVVDPRTAVADEGQVGVARWSPDSKTWNPITHIAGATARRTNRLASVSRDVGVADLFWIDDQGRLATSASAAAAPDTWSAPAQIGAAGVEIFPFANIVAASAIAGRIDVLYLGRVPVVAPAAPPAWRLYNVWWTTADGWTAAHSRIADSGAVVIESLSSIAACNRDAGHLDVFVAGRDDGALYVATLTRATDTWAGPVRIGAAPAGLLRVASVDAAGSHGGGDVQVVVTARDGSLYGTSFRAASSDYGPLARLAL